MVKVKKCDLNELSTWAHDMVMWYWPADTMFWQVLIDHNMDVQYQRSTHQTKAACLRQPINWSMAAILRNPASFVIMCMQPQEYR